MTRICIRCQQPHDRNYRHCTPCHTEYCRERREMNREQQTVNFFQNLGFWTASQSEATQQ